MEDLLKVNVHRSLLKYHQSGQPHSRALFAYTALTISFSEEFESAKVKDVIIRIKLKPSETSIRDPIVAALNPESFKDGKVKNSKRPIRPGLKLKSGLEGNWWHNVKHHLDMTDWEGRKDLVISGVGVETDHVTWHISLKKGSTGIIPAQLPTAIIVLHRGPFFAELEVQANVSGAPKRSRYLEEVATETDIPSLNKIYFDSDTTWDEEQAKYDEMEKDREEEEQKKRREEERNQEEGDFGDEDAYAAPKPVEWQGSIENPE